MNLKKLSSFIRLDEDKTVLIEDILHPKIVLEAPSFQEDKLCIRNSYDAIALPEEKYCPKCNRKYPKYENFCLECAVKLKNIEDKVKVRDIKTNPRFTFEVKTSSMTLHKSLAKITLPKSMNGHFPLKITTISLKALKGLHLKPWMI